MEEEFEEQQEEGIDGVCQIIFFTVPIITLVENMSIYEFDRWLRTDLYGNIGDYREDILLDVYYEITSERGLEEHEMYLLKLLNIV